MPKQEQTIPVNNLSKENVLAIAYSSFERLGWKLNFTSEDKLLGQTAKSWKTYGEEIIITAGDHLLTISSELNGSAIYDLTKRNKKNITAFLATFQQLAAKADPVLLQQGLDTIQASRVATLQAAETEAQQAKEVDAVMNLSKSNLSVTYSIMAINIIVFVLMAVNGVSVFEPTTIDLVNWGANYAPLSFTGDWWRLISCVFVHIGIMHLLFNMYALYMVGAFLEPMLGKLRYIVAYLCTGVFASIVSLWWHQEPLVSAGASGAIFGMFGVFLALLSTNLIPKQVRKGLLQSMAILVVYNLVYGMKSGVDNSAHVGGLLSGLVIGYAYYFTLKTPADQKRIQVVTLVIALLTILTAYRYLDFKKAEMPVNARTDIENQMKDAGYKDTDNFNKAYESFFKLQTKAQATAEKSSLTDEEYKAALNNVSLPAWNEADSATSGMPAMQLSEHLHKKALAVREYIVLRKEEISALNDVIDKNSNENTQHLNEIQDKIATVVKELK